LTGPRPPNPRFHELDGLRGWAALSVAAFHIFWETFGVVLPGVRNPITGALLDGQLDAAVFFILSGEALSSAYLAGPRRLSAVSFILRRYVRLTLPIAATCLIIYLLARAGLTFTAQAGDIVRRPEWLGAFLRLPITPLAFARYALVGVYGHVARPEAVDPFLWTMSLEMLGSLLVLLVLMLRRTFGLPWIAVGVLTLGLAPFVRTSNLACFPLGMMLGAARLRGVFGRIQARSWSAPASWTLLILAAGADGAAHVADVGEGYKIAFATPMMLAVFCNRRLCALFASRLSRGLGTLSFPVYLVQFPVVASLTSGLIVAAAGHGTLKPPMIWAIGLVSLVVCVAGAGLFLPVERLTLWAGRRLPRS
jgi:peptidoglycan/LPS O-acetylase OafA/YrhL